MTILKKTAPWYHRVNAEIFYLIIINIAILLLDFHLLMHYWAFIQFVILLLIIFILLRKSSKIIYQIEFDDFKQELRLSYYQFVFLKRIERISYSELNYNYISKIYGIGNMIKALIFVRSKKYIAEIREKNRIGWSKNDIDQIIDKLKVIIK